MYSTIVDLLTPEPVIVTKMHVPSEEEIAAMKNGAKKIEEPLPAVSESDSELLDLLEEALELKVVVYQAPMWYKYKGESGKKKEGFVEKLKSNPQMLKSLRYEIEKAKKGEPA
jgi:HD superfamily phosphodiesterase